MAVSMEIASRMQRAFTEDVDIDPDKVQMLEARAFNGEVVGKLYIQNNGPVEFSRGLIDAWLYFEYNDGETDSLRIDDEKELKFWIASIPS